MKKNGSRQIVKESFEKSSSRLSPLGCVELDLGDVPRRLQAKRGDEEVFDLVVDQV